MPLRGVQLPFGPVSVSQPGKTRISDRLELHVSEARLSNLPTSDFVLNNHALGAPV